MAKRGKFEKLGTNEKYTGTHKINDGVQNSVQESYRDENKEKTGVLKKIGKRITPPDLNPEKVPEKQNPPGRFTFAKDKRLSGVAAKAVKKPVDKPKMAPFILAFCTFCLMFVCSLLMQRGIFSSLSHGAAAGVISAMFVLVYIAPVAVYIMSNKSRKKAYNMRGFSLSYVPFIVASFALLTCVSALQKYYIAYTFSYSVNSYTPDRNIWLVILTSVVLPAVCEEIFVHGVFQHEVSKYAGGLCAVFASGLVFAMLHFEMQYFFIYLVSGIILSCLTHVTGSVYPAMIVHFVNNMLSLMLSGRIAYVAKARIGGTLLMIIFALFSFLFLIIMLRMAQNISEARYIKAAGVSNEKDDGSDAEADFLVAKQGRTPARFVKVFANPFMLLILALFVVSVIVL